MGGMGTPELIMLSRNPYTYASRELGLDPKKNGLSPSRMENASKSFSARLMM